jgi:hypothetical protein
MLSWFHTRQRYDDEKELKNKYDYPLPNEEVRFHSDWSLFVRVEDREIDVVEESSKYDS